MDVDCLVTKGEESEYFVPADFIPNPIQQKQIGPRRPGKNLEDELTRFTAHRFKHKIAGVRHVQGLWVKGWLDEIGSSPGKVTAVKGSAIDDWAEGRA